MSSRSRLRELLHSRMHPRNLYREPPDFTSLAKVDPDFARQYVPYLLYHNIPGLILS